MRKKSVLDRIFILVGTLILIVVGAVVVINFVRDARVFEQSSLETAGGIQNKTMSDNSTKADEYKTLKYNKPEAASETKTSDSKDNAVKKEESAVKEVAIKIEIINYTGIMNLAEEVKGMLEAGGFQVVSARDEKSVTPIVTTIVERKDGEAGIEVKKVLKVGQIIKRFDSKAAFDITVKIGSDYNP